MAVNHGIACRLEWLKVKNRRVCTTSTYVLYLAHQRDLSSKESSNLSDRLSSNNEISYSHTVSTRSGEATQSLHPHSSQVTRPFIPNTNTDLPLLLIERTMDFSQ